MMFLTKKINLKIIFSPIQGTYCLQFSVQFTKYTKGLSSSTFVPAAVEPRTNEDFNPGSNS
jgi:hypothetical protein